MTFAISDDELSAISRDLESDRVERKASLAGSAPSSIREAICAFANDLPNHRLPGVVLIGVNDDGTPSGCPITDEVLRTLADMKTDGNIVPPPSMTVSKRKLTAVEIALVSVLPSDLPPVRFKGRIHVRTGPRRCIATAQDERLLNEKRRWKSTSFDLLPVPTAALKDLSVRRFAEEYIPSAFSPDVLAANDRSDLERLAACKMVASVEDPVPTVLGVLILANRPRDFIPGAYVQYVRFRGTDVTSDVIDESEIDGPLKELMWKLEEKLKQSTPPLIRVRDSAREERTYEYPLAALIQLAHNAIMHRSYESTNAPVRIMVFSDHIEITNPGGPFGAVTRENFGEPGVVDYRNPALAESMKVLGFVQKFGMGIRLARQELERNGNPPPQVEVSDSLIRWLLWARKPQDVVTGA